MTAISGISKKTFMDATRAELAKIKGSSIKLSQLRQFVAAQFKLQNEHLIEPMFSARSSPAGEMLAPLDIDIGARGIVLNQLRHMFVYTNDEGFIGGYWPKNPRNDDYGDEYFVPLSEIEWWQENPFVFPTRAMCRNALPSDLSDNDRYRIVEVRECPELCKALTDAVMFSTMPPSEDEKSLKMLTHFFGATREAYQDQRNRRPTPPSYPMYVYNAFRALLTKILPAASYPNIEQSPCVATFYGQDGEFGENVSSLPLSQRIALWSGSGDHGLSSQFLFSHMTGVLSLGLISSHKTPANVPYNASAFLCCVQLLECMPEWKSRIGEMAQYDAWKPYVEQWEHLTAILMRESNLTDDDLYDTRRYNTQAALEKIKNDLRWIVR